MIREENLITLSGDFLPGQRLTKIGDTFVPVGFGADKLPGTTVIKDIGKGLYYKCTSVGNTTWSGNKAFQNEDDTWGFEDAVTSGLSFTEIKPEKGKVYSFDALIEVKLWDGNLSLTDGLVFHLPLTEPVSIAPTGQQLTTVGSPLFTEFKGIKCITKNGEENNNYITVDFPAINAPFTLSFWINATETDGSCQVIALKNYNLIYSWYGYNTNDRGYYIPENNRPQYNNGTWMNIVYSISGTNSKIYVNGVDQGIDFNAITENEINMPADTWYINQARSTSYGWQSFFGYLANVRIYTKEADKELVSALYNELTPTA